MTLGKQFENTYWEDKKGRTQVSLAQTDPEESGSSYDARMGYPHSSSQKYDHDVIGSTFGGDVNAFIRNASDEGLAPRNPSLQGVLFDPYTGTGLSRDPMVDNDERQKRINQSLGLELTDQQEDHWDGFHPRPQTRYASATERLVNQQNEHGDIVSLPNWEEIEASRSKSASRMQDIMDQSDIPIQEFRKLATPGFVASEEDTNDPETSGYYRGSERKVVIDPDSRPSTLIHEYGHASDFSNEYGHDSVSSRGSDPLNARAWQGTRLGGTRADAVEEGIADGYTDRYYTHAGALESTRRAVHEVDDLHLRGYSISSNRWHSDTDRALYAASRLIAGRTGSGESIPHKMEISPTNREFVQQPKYGEQRTDDTPKVNAVEAAGFDPEYDDNTGYEPLNEQTRFDNRQLAHIWEHNPDIHEAMDNAGMADHVRNVHALHYNPNAKAHQDHADAVAAGVPHWDRPPIVPTEHDVQLDFNDPYVYPESIYPEDADPAWTKGSISRFPQRRKRGE